MKAHELARVLLALPNIDVEFCGSEWCHPVKFIDQTHERLMLMSYDDPPHDAGHMPEDYAEYPDLPRNGCVVDRRKRIAKQQIKPYGSQQ